MRFKYICVGALLFAAVACSGADKDDSRQPSAPNSSSRETVVPTTPFTATVDLGRFMGCDTQTCWLPTQFSPKLVERESVSHIEQWPMDGDTVEVLCQTKGERFNDPLGQPVTKWYGIYVPGDKLGPGAEKRADEAPSGGHIGYVGASWLDVPMNATAPAC